MDLPIVDDLFAAEFAQGRSPGLVYAVVRDGEILHSRGLGTTTVHTETPPTPDSVQRIASMTKSFTAAAILLLRDRGRLGLDDPVSAYVPALAGLRHAPDAPDLTIRHLLTMGGGLLTDDPWGDRLESQAPEELDAFLAAGFTTGGVPGTAFEYANLGYAILGRVIDAVLGEDGGFRRFVLEELTGPLGMTATAYDARDVGPALVPGHHRRDGAWTVVPQVLSGTFSAMGGLHSSVTDLARWVAGFTDAFRRPDAPHPLSAASRREMQQLHRFAGVAGTLAALPPAGGAQLAATASGYGFGLIAEHHSDHGHVVQHSGGYPGYGSHMRWHPATGLGIVALANGTYAGPGATARDALRLLVAGQRTGSVPSTVTPAIIEAVTAKLTADGPVTDELFTANVALDVPETERQEQLAAARELVGPPTGPAGQPFVDGYAFGLWSVPAERGRYDVEIKVAPTPEPRVQWLQVTAVPEPAPPLRAAAERVLAGEAGDAETGAALRLAAAFGTPVVAGVLAGDGASRATYAVRAGTTWWRLEVSTGDPSAVSLTAVPTSEADELDQRFGRPGA